MNPYEKLTKLREKYRLELPKKCQDLETIFNEASIKGFKKEPFDHFKILIHNLVGSGATFNFHKVSHNARILEDAFKKHKEPPLAKDVQQYKYLMESLINLCSNLGSYEQPVLEHKSLNESSKKNIKTKELYFVDDDDFLHEELKAQLETFGYKVTSFYNTEDFEFAIKENNPDIVLMDIMYPNSSQNGIEVIASIKKKINKSFPLIFISVKNDFITRANAVKVGSSAFVTKPIDIVNLLDTLERIIQKKEKELSFKVLLLDDEKTLADFHASLLEDVGMETKTIYDPIEVLEAISEFQPDLILMDLYMPKYSGIEVGKVIRQIDSYLTIPILYLSSESDGKIKSEAMEIGAEDFMVKPIKPKEMIERIENKAKRYKNLRNKIQQDSLTKLYNHTTIIELLSKDINLSQRQNSPLCYTMIDIDHFKKVNDTYGHQSGDAVLKTLSKLLTQRVRSYDKVGRYGGEEFCIVLPYTNIKDAFNLLDKIRMDFAEVHHTGEDGTTYNCTFSCGISELKKREDITSIIERADQAMYSAKKEGRNRVIKAN